MADDDKKIGLMVVRLPLLIPVGLLLLLTVGSLIVILG